MVVSISIFKCINTLMTKIAPYENFLFSTLEKAARRLSLKEQADEPDHVQLDIPLLIRLLELAREDIKDDVTLHKVVERMITLKNQGVLNMDHYNFIAGKAAQQDIAPEKEPELEDIRKLAGL